MPHDGSLGRFASCSICRKAIVAATGAKKKDAVRRALSGVCGAFDCPAAKVKVGHGSVVSTRFDFDSTPSRPDVDKPPLTPILRYPKISKLLNFFGTLHASIFKLFRCDLGMGAIQMHAFHVII